MATKESIDIISAAGIRPTSVRILVYKAISELHDTFSLSDLEEHLISIDKSSIFRALTLFHEHNLIHSVDDGSGSLKYCLCHNHGECNLNEAHAHFHCEVCNKTFCLDDHDIPSLSVPKGFVVNEVNFVIKGVCAKCASKNR